MNDGNFLQMYIEACLTYWYYLPIIFIVVLGINVGLLKFFNRRD